MDNTIYKFKIEFKSGGAICTPTGTIKEVLESFHLDTIKRIIAKKIK